MQGDLISRSELIKCLEESVWNDVLEVVKEQPTAYSVEKVVNVLHLRALDHGADANLNQNRYTTIAHELKIREDECRKIMEIVRNGGKE